MNVLKNFAEEAIKYNDGNIVEIGGGYGEYTKIFLEIANKYDRKVLLIDPFETGWDEMPESYRYEFLRFYRNVREIDMRNLWIHFESSQDQSCKEIVKKYSPCFAYVDGLQFEESVLSDLDLVHGAKLICVDDFDRVEQKSQVPSAVKQFLDKTDYKLIQTEDKKRAYLCRSY